MDHENNRNLERIKQAGFFTKGFIYILIGGLSALAAVNLGGQTSGRSETTQFISQLPLGKVLLIIVAIGLLAYSLWRLYSAYEDPDNKAGDTRWKKRIVFLISGLTYLFIAFSFAKPVFTGNANSGGDQRKQLLARLLENSWGIYVIGAIALIVLIVAIVQFKKAYSGKYMQKIDDHPDYKKEYRLVKNTGKIGYTARGFVFLIVAYSLLKVALDHNANNYDGTKGVLVYIAGLDYGKYILLATTLGLVCYGIFNVMVARHTQLTRLS